MRGRPVSLVLFSFFLFFVATCFAQETLTITTYYPSPYGSYHDITVTHNLYVGQTEEGYAGVGNGNYGAQLWFSGSPDITAGYDNENSDPIWMARYNLSSDVSQLRLNIGDNTLGAGQADSFVVGAVESTTGTWTPRLFVRSDGAVGINTASPGGVLHVLSPSGQGNITIGGPSDSGNTYSALYLDDETPGSGNAWVMGHSVAGDPFNIGYFPDGSSTVSRFVTIQTDGDVGIGTTAPSDRLHVNGGIRLEGNLIAPNNSHGTCTQVTLTSPDKYVDCPDGMFVQGLYYEDPTWSDGADYHNAPEIYAIRCCDL
ncbi:MAG: hypothetical protein FJZ09_05460 [Candidatus Omnitrophica bacterium]|nr:hypothetical protein [Candidatus Omnitrophota bacterium]